VEHLRRPSQRWRQLAPRLHPLQRAADQPPAAGLPLLRLCAGGRRRAKPLGRVRQPGGRPAQLCDAQGHRGLGHLPGLSRPVQEGRGHRMTTAHTPADALL
ncbi:Uncharacterized protein APZ42_002970, partial [Daphnia magna]